MLFVLRTCCNKFFKLNSAPQLVLFQGTSADQDSRFADKKKKLIKQMKFEDVIEKKVISPDKLTL